MIFSNSIKSIVRSKGKTALFSILIFSLTLALCICVSVWAAIDAFLEECEDFFTTIGVFEYIGTEYPNDVIYDSYMDDALQKFDFESISSHSSVLLWDQSIRSSGYVEGFWRTDQYMPKRMLSVIIVGNISDSNQDFYTGIAMKTGYSLLIEDDTIIHIDKDFGPLESDHYYILFGEAYYGRTPIINLARSDYENAIAKNLGISMPYKRDITIDKNGFSSYEIPKDSMFNEFSETLRVISNSVLVVSTKDILSLYPFNQNELYILDGRIFSQDEYASESKVCIISQLMAERMSVGVGDKINLSTTKSDYPDLEDAFFADTGFSDTSDYEVVGITNSIGDKFWYVYVPFSDEFIHSNFPIGYTIGQAVIKNGYGEEFYGDIEPLLGDRIRLTVYDQGYSSVEIPYTTLLTVVKILTAVFVLVELAVCVFFGYLFVYRQKDTIETMLMLGSGNMRVFSYFLFSSGIIAFSACFAATAAGRFLSRFIMALVRKIAEYFRLIDARFSNARLSITKTLEFNPDVGWNIFIIVSSAVLVSCIISCIVFLSFGFIKRKKKGNKRIGPKREKRSMYNPSTSIKYAILSVFRGGPRTIVVPVLALTVILFFGQLADVMQSQHERIEYIYDNNVIEGYFTDFKGKQISKQNVNAYNVAKLNHSGYIEDLCITVSEPSYFVGTALKNGKTYDIPPLIVPGNSFVRESLQAEISRGPNITFTNNLSGSPEFYYADRVEIDYMSGYDDTMFTAIDDEDACICIVTKTYMQEHDLSYGDVIRVAVDKIVNSNEYFGLRIFSHYDLKIVGSYIKHGEKDTIYSPLSEKFDVSLIWNQTDNKEEDITDANKKELLDINLNSVTFKIKDSRSLLEFKNFMSNYGYSQVNKISMIREFVVLKDSVMNSSLANVTQQIRYLNIAYPILYVLIAVVAYAVSYLMVVSRKKEFATMAGLGTDKKQAFYSFFSEQMILCITGAVIGLVIWYVIFKQLSYMHIALVFGYILFYLTGSAVSINVMSKTGVLAVMADRD
jgi:ABC-type lipoprotein release transport system permease subunit